VSAMISPTVAPAGWLGRNETGDPEGVTGGKTTVFLSDSPGA
jgi:hypothetical protein